VAQLVQDFREEIVESFQPFDVFDHAYYLEIQLIDTLRERGSEPAFVVLY
jgi:hypothetical protein